MVPASLRSSVYAFDRCFEGAVSALSAPLVGVVAERCFGYVTAFHEAPSPSRQLSNARALGSGLLVRDCASPLLVDALQRHLPARNCCIRLPSAVCGLAFDLFGQM